MVKKWIAKEARDVLSGRCLCKECTSLIQEPDQEDTMRYVCARAQRLVMQREESGRNKGDWGKQVWMVLEGRSKPWDIRAEEEGNELKEVEQREWDGG